MGFKLVKTFKEPWSQYLFSRFLYLPHLNSEWECVMRSVFFFCYWIIKITFVSSTLVLLRWLMCVVIKIKKKTFAITKKNRKIEKTIIEHTLWLFKWNSNYYKDSIIVLMRHFNNYYSTYIAAIVICMNCDSFFWIKSIVIISHLTNHASWYRQDCDLTKRDCVN